MLLIIAAGDTVSDLQKTAEGLRIFFVYIEKSIANPISRDSSITSTTSSKRTNTSIFLYPSSTQEVFNVIKALKENKARRTLDIEMNF